MIERMKKITLLVAEKERDNFLLSLRKAGAVHIKGIKEPEAGELPEAEDELLTVRRVIKVLSSYDGNAAGKAEELGEKELFSRAEETIEAFNEKEKVLQSIDSLENDRKWYATWGAADPGQIKELKAKGVNIRLYRLTKEDYRKLKATASLRVVRKDKNFVYAMFLDYGTDERLPFEEETVPEKPLPEIGNELKELKTLAEEKESFLKGNAKHLGPLEALAARVVKRIEFLTVKFGMKEEEKFSYMQGFCPAKELGTVQSLAKGHGAGYMVEEPGEPHETPTLITNPRWIDIISPVFKFMNTVPGYEEFDISFVFLVFFSIFFAMLVGDAGYGILFLAATYFIRKKTPHLPPQPFFLMYLLSGATIFWGAVTGTWFGAQEIAKLPYISGMVIERVDSFRDANQNFMMFLCFVIGAVHLTIAHITRMIRYINSPRVVAEVGWISVIWGMFFAAGTLVIARPFPGFALYLIAGGVFLVLVFANFQKNFIKGMLSTLTELPLSVIAAFSDIVSYVRLFAVGYASVVVSQSFNDMAVGGGVSGVVGGLVAAMVLFFGHSLNIVLCLMAVVVHGIRLNMLEYSSHVGMQWSGKEYRPFSE